ncbi:STAS/SEC14 domain-containing protein [Vitiosangium sp. GDMCC 1.1324]|uniref:STAS/SEC14 domain-containing protein n=1 Tax=Vitiosangium sp. (strain GDMCC 1.1324) TaxID=2138576 RepID=UPI000D337435|nr:STAS/SEC14 domain-containing protein [Vitiosangium sp. GDMCC 1.1324]PTL84206.1 STAS/SEC14 domain-containing protein [Vitiosangium sp. GDMCC 1.1324]
MPFQITVYEADRIIDVVYPPQPSAEDVSDYLKRIRETIIRMNGPWSALVDQGQLRVMPPDMVAIMANLNAFAQLHHMKRSARVVSDAASGLQAWRMTKKAMLTIPTRTFETREDALAWLRNPDDE